MIYCYMCTIIMCPTLATFQNNFFRFHIFNQLLVTICNYSPPVKSNDQLFVNCRSLLRARCVARSKAWAEYFSDLTGLIPNQIFKAHSSKAERL